MLKRKTEDTKFNPKKTKYIDIIYSEFDSDADSDDDPKWLPPESDSSSGTDSPSETKTDSDSSSKSETDSTYSSKSDSLSDSSSKSESQKFPIISRI